MVYYGRNTQSIYEDLPLRECELVCTESCKIRYTQYEYVKYHCVKLNFNLNFGRQYKGANKGIQNIDTDSGILQGTKE